MPEAMEGAKTIAYEIAEEGAGGDRGVCAHRRWRALSLRYGEDIRRSLPSFRMAFSRLVAVQPFGCPIDRPNAARPRAGARPGPWRRPYPGCRSRPLRASRSCRGSLSRPAATWWKSMTPQCGRPKSWRRGGPTRRACGRDCVGRHACTTLRLGGRSRGTTMSSL